MDYYLELGVSKHASEQEIKLAYRTLAKKYHPDRNKALDAEDKIKKIMKLMRYQVILLNAKNMMKKPIYLDHSERNQEMPTLI